MIMGPIVKGEWTNGECLGHKKRHGIVGTLGTFFLFVNERADSVYRFDTNQRKASSISDTLRGKCQVCKFLYQLISGQDNLAKSKSREEIVIFVD